LSKKDDDLLVTFTGSHLDTDFAAQILCEARGRIGESLVLALETTQLLREFMESCIDRGFVWLAQCRDREK
jgi:hypothetical protein